MTGILQTRLQNLRAFMAEAGLDALIVPKADEFQNEHSIPENERLEAISGFTGSAGAAVITEDKAALFTDGRYVVQAQREIDPANWAFCQIPQETVSGWLSANAGRNSKVGFDPKLHLPREIDALEKAGLVPIALKSNPVDRVWQDRPISPGNAAFLHPIEFTGEAREAKLARLSKSLKNDQIDVLVVSALDNLCWLFNIRGHDLDMLPVVFGRGLVLATGKAILFVEDQKFSAVDIEAICASGDIAIERIEQFDSHLRAIRDGASIRLDETTANVWLRDLASSAGLIPTFGPDPITLMKAQKNQAELRGMREAHIRDGLAMVRFMAWFDEHAKAGTTEEELAQRLEDFRSVLEDYRGPSFGTISAAGENAALPHYHHSASNPGTLEAGDVYLVDSGAQFGCGTTDITRVLVLGEASAEIRRRYTQVLKGHIALNRARFPKGITGSRLDAFARQFLWDDGVDFEHGTGHGVGAYLSVHEGPQSISPRQNATELLPGMVLSNEPGFYEPGAFGIRIENLVVVRRAEPQPEFATYELLEFETITFAPYERKLLDLSLLSADEIRWVDGYHADVLAMYTEKLSESESHYLETACAPLR